jgi:stress response protein YsnF
VKVVKKPVVEGEVSVRSESTGETKPVEAELKHEELRSERTGKVEVRGAEGEIKEKKAGIDERAA